MFHLVVGEDLHRHSLLSNPIDLSIKYLKWIRVAQTQIACEHVFPQIFRENRFSVFLAVLDEFVIHICSNLGEKFRFKTHWLRIIRYARASSKYSDFLKRHLHLRNRLLDQGYKQIRLIRSLKKFIFRYQYLVEIYSVSAEKIISDAFSYSENV